MLTLLKAGFATSVQDQGRFSLAQFGVSRSGALDQPAMVTANLLVGNDPHGAVLEITQGNCLIRFEADCWFALTGAGCNSMLDQRSIATGWRHFARAGQQLRLHSPLRGMRSYLAVCGGFKLPTVMGSLSTDLKAQFGGYQGRFLKDGDQLALNPTRQRFTQSVGVRQLLWGNRVRVIPGPEYSEFTRESQLAFWRTGWMLTAQSDRMGYRLQGRLLKRQQPRDMLSHGVLPGTIQVPPNGQPVVLLADAQTTGGYSRIGQVIESDLYHLAQLRPREPLHFSYCTLDEARRAQAAQQQVLEMIRWGLEQR